MLYPKYHKYTIKNTSDLKTVPQNWDEFVALTTIRSGGEMKQFQFYDYQKLIIDLARKYKNIVIIKSRQTGCTQCILSKFLHDACLNPAASSVLFMRNGNDASAVSRRARQMLATIPQYAIPENDSVGYLKIKGKGDIYFKNSGSEGSRSLDGITGYLFDEAAFCSTIESIFAASLPSSVLAGNNVTKFVVSTPSAKSGWYWDTLSSNNNVQDGGDIEQLCNEVAESRLYKDIPGCYWFLDSSGWIKFILHWSAHPIYSQMPNYIEERIKEMGGDEEKVQREFNLKFVDSSVAVFTSDLIRKNAVATYEAADTDKIYYAGLDTSTTGNDYCVLTILKEENGVYSIVHQYRKRQQTSEYHIFNIVEILKQYRPIKTGIETTGGVGTIYLEQLSRQLPSLYFEKIHTTQDSKAAMVGAMQLALERECLRYPSNSPIVDEMLSFRREGNKLESAPGKHDDTVMSAAFALTVTPFNREKIGFNAISLKSA